MSEIKPIQILTSVTGPGYVDLMEYFSPVDDADDGSGDGIIFVGYDAKTLGVDGIFHVVCAIPERERHYAELIVTAVNAHADLLAAIDGMVEAFHQAFDNPIHEAVFPEVERLANAAAKARGGE